LARERVGATVPPGLLDKLRLGSRVTEWSTVFFDGGQRQVKELFSDL